MNRVLRVILAGTLALPVSASLGCGKDEAKPNAELQVPNVPPGRGAEGKTGAAPKSTAPTKAGPGPAPLKQ